MKKYVVFLSGVVCGVILLLLIQFGAKHFNLNVEEEVPIDGDTIIEENPLLQTINRQKMEDDPFYSDNETVEPGEVIHEKSFKIVDVGNAFNALVVGKDEFGGYGGTVYLLKQGILDKMEHGDITFYDGKIINIPKGKEVRMFGTYTYETRGAGIKTVPIIRIRNKQ